MYAIGFIWCSCLYVKTVFCLGMAVLNCEYGSLCQCIRLEYNHIISSQRVVIVNALNGGCYVCVLLHENFHLPHLSRLLKV